MSLKKVRQTKADKGFKIWDLIVYGAIIALAVVLFIVVFTTRDTSPLSGIRIYSKGAAVFEYSFESGKYQKLSEAADLEISDEGDKLIIKISCSEGYNVVELGKSGYVKVTDADCANKDCVHMHDIVDNSSAIYCTPHGLRIVPYEFEDDGIIIM